MKFLKFPSVLGKVVHVLFSKNKKNKFGQYFWPWKQDECKSTYLHSANQVFKTLHVTVECLVPSTTHGQLYTSKANILNFLLGVYNF